MKTIGLIGGMSWESTALYYRLINEGVRDRLGRLHSARIVLYSLDFEEIESLQRADDWSRAGDVLADAARGLERAGADFILICTNTMHRVADAVTRAVSIPLLHLADATAEQIVHRGFLTVGLLGTAFTMEQDFYKARLIERFGLTVVVPDEPDRAIVHRVIYDELCRGVVSDASRREYLRIIEALRGKGAEAVIEGCTEIVMLVGQADTGMPLFDTTSIHARAAVDRALGARL
ncbi:MAG: aspartate/glutamate racemase family protein [Proteobacteria bacterium]|nr:MAG: aspartate/glutamate racemase family protein [Pseudomonadota bacterium]